MSMDAMSAALKAKRSGGHMGAPSGGLMAEAPEQEGSGMHGLVQSLSPEQKQELLGLLSADVGAKGEASASAIAKGAPSDEEHAQIQSRMQGESADEESAEGDEDEIGMSMLSPSDKAPGPHQSREPRNLGERVKMSIASKLKGKGKL